eukprot:1690703-Amphidinium_carterae.2
MQLTQSNHLCHLRHAEGYGVQAQSLQRSLGPSWIDIHNRFKEDSCCKSISQSDVKRCGQKWSLMCDSGAAVSIAPPSFAPHMPHHVRRRRPLSQRHHL